MAHHSTPDLLALHGVRVLGGPSTTAIAERFRLSAHTVREHLLDAQAYGWVNRHEFFGETWSLTSAGKAENERQLSAELDALAGRDIASAVHQAFLPLNRLHGEACTRWQLRPTPWDRMAKNDHTDLRWDDAVLSSLEEIDRRLAEVLQPLAGLLARFASYPDLRHRAIGRVSAGDAAWLDSPAVESCQLVWIQLHEDLLATLGIPRGGDALPPE